MHTAPPHHTLLNPPTQRNTIRKKRKNSHLTTTHSSILRTVYVLGCLQRIISHYWNIKYHFLKIEWIIVIITIAIILIVLRFNIRLLLLRLPLFYGTLWYSDVSVEIILNSNVNGKQPIIYKKEAVRHAYRQSR